MNTQTHKYIHMYINILIVVSKRVGNDGME